MSAQPQQTQTTISGARQVPVRCPYCGDRIVFTQRAGQSPYDCTQRISRGLAIHLRLRCVAIGQ